MSALPDIARATAERHGMFPPGEPVLALVSGGADSTSLLRLLASGALGPLELRVLHVDHMLRGEQSAGDAAFVAALCERLSVQCTVVRYDVDAFASAEGLNLEDAGRRVRYRFAEEQLDAVAGAGRGRIATAHTFDDSVETFLMRLVAGAGPGALRGIRPVRGRLVRPLIDARRDDVVAYLADLGQDWREDATNADTSRLRARVRHEVLPALEAVNPRLREALARTMAVLGDEDALLAEMALGLTPISADTNHESVAFDLAMMRSLTRPMARRVVREALGRTFPDASRLEFAHIEALVDGMEDERFARDLPFGLRARTECGKMYVSRGPGELPPVEPALLDIPGVADLGAAGAIEATFAAPDAPSDDPDSALIDAARLRSPLVVDAPRDGDRIRPLGMTGSKKLSDLLIDAKVPRRRRPATPVVRSGEDVVWVAGVRLSEEYKVTAETKTALRLRWRRGGEEGNGTDAP
jgi:tRNA(Ile)-lysidine synthase